MKVIKYQESFGSSTLHKLWPRFWLGLLIIALIFAITFILPIFLKSAQKYWWVVLIIGLFVLKYTTNLFDLFVDYLNNFRYGIIGEEEVAKILGESLGDNYTYITNYVIPGTRIGDLDGLLIGPKGVILIEVKNYTGVFRFSGKDMYRRLKGDVYRLYRKNPLWQINRQEKHLKKFMKERGLDVRIIPIVTLAGGKISSINGETGVFITEINKLVSRISRLSEIPNWSNEKVLNALKIG